MWAVLPIKELGEAKRRLAELLTPEERRTLSRAMCEDVIGAVTAAKGLVGVLVVTRDAEVAGIAAAAGARVLAEPEARGINAAVRFATATLAEEGVEAVLIIPADLPLLTPSAIERVLGAHRADRAVTLVPDREEKGTNAIACTPPGVIEFHYGEPSFAAHKDAARAIGVEPAIMHIPEFALDIDTKEDLVELLGHARTSHTHAVLATTDIAKKIGQVALSAAGESRE